MNMRQFVILLTCIGLANAVITGVITGSQYTVSSVSTLTFEAQLSTQIPLNGYLTLDFSTGFNLNSSIGCHSVYALDVLTPCSVVTKSQLQLSNAKSSDYLIIFNVTNVTLPNYVSSFFVVITSYTSTGVQIENSGPTAFKLATVPDLLSVTLTPLSNVVGATTDLQISLMSLQSVQTTGWIILQLPKWNSGTQSISLVKPFFQIQNAVMTSNGYLIPCSNPNHPTLICQLTVNYPTSTSTISTTFDQLKISGFSKDFTQLTVQTAGTLFLNPPSTKLINTFSAASYISTGMVVTASIKIVLQVTVPAILSASDVQLTVQDGGINAQTTYSFTVQTPLPGPVGLKIQIQIPSQLSITSIIDPNSLVLTSAAGYAPVAEIPHLEILNKTTQTVMLSLLIPNSNYYVDQGNFIRFDLFDLVNAPSIITSNSFVLTFLEFDDVIMTTNGGITTTAQPGQLKNVQVLPDSYKVRDQVPYYFSFITTNRIFQTGQIYIKVPKQITVTSNLSLQPITTISQSAATISYNATSHVILISNAFQQNYNSAQLVEFVIVSGLTNAQSTQPISAFNITTLDSLGGAIDAGSSAILVYAPNEIQSITATACSNIQTASQTQQVCTYKLQFLIGAAYPILIGSTIEIDLPNDLSISNTQTTQSGSSTIGLADLSSTFVVTSNLSTVIVTNAFTAASSPNGIDYKQDTFAVQIAGVISPRTTAPTLSFKARIRDSKGYLQYTKLQGVYSNVYEARPFQRVVIKRTNETNGDDSGVYNFTLQFSSVVMQNEYIQITPPDNIVIYPGGINQCTGTRLLAKQLVCSIIKGSLFVLIAPLDTSADRFYPGDTVQFQVTDIRNPISLEPTQSFDIYIATSTAQPYYVNQIVQGLSMLNIYEGQLSQVRVIPDSNQFGAVTDYSIYFVTFNQLEQYSYINISFPENFYNFAGATWPCIAIKNIQASIVCTPTNNVMTITLGYTRSPLQAGTEVGIKLQQITNPSQSVSNAVINEQFYIETISVDNYGIDRSYNLDFSIGCSYPCLTCTNQQTQCTSCQQLNSKNMLLYQQTCIVQCPVGTYADSNYTCQKCNPLCQRCDTDPNKCSQCRSDLGFPYLTQVGTCTSTCTNGTYLNEASKTCQQCQSSCNTCTSAIQCLSCDPGYFFIDGTCVQTCPANSIKFDSVEVQECLKCKAPCASCIDTVDKCTSCSPSTFLYKNQCLNKCPATYLPDENNICFEASQQTYPFISMSVTASILLLIAISWVFHKKTEKSVVFLALQSGAMVGFWIYMLVFLILDQHQASATLISIALFSNFVINYLWWEYYNDKLVKNDVEFQQFQTKFAKTIWVLKLACLLVTFDYFRLLYSHLFGWANCQADILKKDKHFKRINRYELFQISFVYLITIIAAGYNLFYTWYGRQIFWIDIECCAMGSFMLVYKLIVIFQSEKDYIQKVLHTNTKQIKVQSAGVDDEPDEIAQNIHENGLESSKLKIKDMTNEQRVLAVKAVFKKLVGSQEPGYLLNHGGQLAQKYKTYNQVAENTINTTEVFEDGPIEMQDQRMFSDKELINFQSAPLNAESALANNKQLQQRHQQLQNELKNKTSKQQQEDSDDLVENFTSEKWGPGATQVVAEHYKTLQTREPSNPDIARKLQEVKMKQQVKRLAKEKAFEFAESSKKLDQQLQQQQTENDKLKEFIRQLEIQIANENERLNGVKKTKRDELEFAENAFYTSNEDGMGVSPNQYVDQNRMPKVAHKQKDYVSATTMPVNVAEKQQNQIAQQKQSSESKSITASEIKALRKQVKVQGGVTESDSDEMVGSSGNMRSSGNQKLQIVESNQRSRVSHQRQKSVGNRDSEDVVGSSGNLRSSQRQKQAASSKRSGISSRKQQSVGLRKSKRQKSLADYRGTSSNDQFGRLHHSSSANIISSSDNKLKKHNSVNKVHATEGKVTRKAHKKQNSRGGIKDRELIMNPLNREKDNYEYYTTEDEFGLPVNKLRKKVSPKKLVRNSSKRAKSISKVPRRSSGSSKGRKVIKKGSSSSKGKRVIRRGSSSSKGNVQNRQQSTDSLGQRIQKSQDSDLEFYSTFDKQGRKVQKLMRKSKSQNRAIGVSNIQPVVIRPEQREEQKNSYNFRPGFPDMSIEQSTIKGSIMGATGDNFTRFSQLSSRGNLTSANDFKGRSRSNNAPQIQTQRALNHHSEVQSQLTTYRALQKDRASQQRNLNNTSTLKDNHSTALRDAGITVMKTDRSKSIKRTKKVSAPQRDYSGAYFNHTNFEKAVIATNGKAPFNNKEVEVITKIDKFDPKDFNFQNRNNWVNQTINNESRVLETSPQPKRRQNKDIASASVTATTVFQGLNHNSQLLSSVQHTEQKLQNGLSLTQQQFGFGGSPVTLLNGIPEVSNLSPFMDSSNEKPRGNLMYEQAQNFLLGDK